MALGESPADSLQSLRSRRHKGNQSECVGQLLDPEGPTQRQKVNSPRESLWSRTTVDSCRPETLIDAFDMGKERWAS